ncbi:hypothetical protein STEG23_035483, partial [Scotinomys teguina]
GNLGRLEQSRQKTAIAGVFHKSGKAWQDRCCDKHMVLCTVGVRGPIPRPETVRKMGRDHIDKAIAKPSSHGLSKAHKTLPASYWRREPCGVDVLVPSRTWFAASP